MAASLSKAKQQREKVANFLTTKKLAPIGTDFAEPFVLSVPIDFEAKNPAQQAMERWQIPYTWMYQQETTGRTVCALYAPKAMHEVIKWLYAQYYPKRPENTQKQLDTK